MQLNDEQRRTLDGTEGPFLAQCMRWLVEWGEAMRARRLVPVANTHALVTVPGNLVFGAGDKPLQAAMDLLRSACRHQVRCHSTAHITFAHEDRYDEIEMPAEQVAAQHEVMQLAREAGFLMTYTCAPYLVGNVPLKGEVCAWTESSAVVYANSILGARTTRHGTESAIAAALTGWVPEFGVLLDENRRATLQVDVAAELCSPTDWGALGYFAGQAAGLEVPVFTGAPRPSQEDAKQLCAALASGGGVTMCHIAGVTPEAPTLEDALGGRPLARRVSFGDQQLRDAYRGLRTHTGEEIDTVILGCPHASLEEISQIAGYLQGKHMADGVTLWVCTAYSTRAAAQRLGHAQDISQAGGYLFCDSCPPTSMRVQARRIVTAGFKQAHYARGMIGAEVIVDRWQRCLDAALTGRWSDDR
ncbi:MAG: aconitase X catalytic domain-containing protein [Planctomycetota bacterium]